MRLKNGCALLGSKSQLWVRPLLQLPRPGARNEACSPSPPAPGLSGAEAEQPRSCQQLSAVTRRRPSAAVVAQLQRSFRPSCWGVGCTLVWQLSLEQERRPVRRDIVAWKIWSKLLLQQLWLSSTKASVPKMPKGSRHNHVHVFWEAFEIFRLTIIASS